MVKNDLVLNAILTCPALPVLHMFPRGVECVDPGLSEFAMKQHVLGSHSRRNVEQMAPGIQTQQVSHADDKILCGFQVVFIAVFPKAKIEIASVKVAIVLRPGGIKLFNRALVSIRTPGYTFHWE